MTTQLPRRVRRLKNLKINEVSSVDHGAGEGVKVMLHKRDNPIEASISKGFDALHESVASILDDDGLVDKSEALAETMSQAHEYFQSVGEVSKADDADIIEKEYTPMSAYDALMQKAVQLCKANPGLSRHQAFAKAYSDPANRHLADADRIQRRSRHVHKDADAEDRLTERAAELRKQNPNVSVDDAIDRVKKRNPELVEVWRKGRTNVIQSAPSCQDKTARAPISTRHRPMVADGKPPMASMSERQEHLTAARPSSRPVSTARRAIPFSRKAAIRPAINCSICGGNGARSFLA
jgi:hypothetical protein